MRVAMSQNRAPARAERRVSKCAANERRGRASPRPATDSIGQPTVGTFARHGARRLQKQQAGRRSAKDLTPSPRNGGVNSEPRSMSSGVVCKSYGRVSDEQQKAMTGLEFVQGLVDGSLPLNTMAQTLGYDITEVESGRVAITVVPNTTLIRQEACMAVSRRHCSTAVWGSPFC